MVYNDGGDSKVNPGIQVTAQDAYIDALYDLAQTICRGDVEIAALEQEYMKNPTNAEIVHELFQRKADLIAVYTQKVERGGLV